LACRGGVEDDAHPGGVEGEVEEATEKCPEEPAGDEGEGGRLLKMKKMLEGLQALASLRESRVEWRRGRLAPGAQVRSRLAMAMVVVAGDVCWGLYREEEMVAAADLVEEGGVVRVAGFDA
jgi:hypothetical protein